MKKLILFTFTMLISLISLMSFTAYANEPVYTAKGAAIKGYDAVSYFTQSEPAKGVADFSYEYKGATWRFASAENLDLFKSNPEKYAPQYNGYCAYAMGSYGKKVKVDPKIYTIRDDKLYLNFNKKIGKQFNENIEQYIVDGDKNWENILTK